MKVSSYPFPVRLLIFLLNMLLLFTAIIVARDYLYPIVLGMLFAYLLFPIANWLEKNHFPRILANLVSIIFGIIVIASALVFIYNQIEILLQDLPQIKKQASQNIGGIVSSVNDYLGLDEREIRNLLSQRVNHLFDSSSDFINNVFSATTGTLVKAGLLPVYVFLFLYYRTKIAYFILKVVPEKDKKLTIDILREIADVTKKYMGGVFIVVLILCILNSTGLYIIGIKYALILGIISALFNFIPYFGTLLGGLVPLVFSFLVMPSPIYPLRVIFLFIIIQFLENNILTPNITGGAVKINPMVTIFGVVAGALVWGLPGMFAIIPILGMVKIITSHLEDGKSYAFLLGTGGTSKHAINRKNLMSVFKSLGFKNHEKNENI
ncbi:MAG: AI-2E family transporter [Bacteroidales bacterium]|nr:AI-2E family transporter [Bacteroidales bacterium]MCF8398542.1 AI-2E family transporter [Bacteroidales bacterium]